MQSACAKAVRLFNLCLASVGWGFDWIKEQLHGKKHPHVSSLKVFVSGARAGRPARGRVRDGAPPSERRSNLSATAK